MEQRSIVQVGSTTMAIQSEVVMEPEMMVVTRLLDDEGAELEKRHSAVPAAVAADLRGRGPRALSLFLHSSHLCFVQKLLWASPSRRALRSTALQVGVLGLQIFDPQGHVQVSMGEDQIPGNWLKVSYLLVDLARTAGLGFGRGPCQRAIATGRGIAAILLSDAEHEVRVCYVDPGEISPVELEPTPQVEAV